MTAAVARWATEDDHPLLDTYARFCHQLEIGDHGLRDRLRLARAFLAEHPDLEEWMARPTRTRLADLARVKAWPLISWAALCGRVRVDLDLLAAKDLGGMSATVRQLWPIEFNQLWETAGRLGWSFYWSRSVIDQFVPAVVAWSTAPPAHLTADTLDGFEAALGDVVSASATTRKAWHGRLFGLRQLLFECGQLPEPPTRGPRPAPLEERLAVIPAVEIREAIIRYIRARSAVLAPSSVEGLVTDLIPFGTFLGEQFPHVETLRQLERDHIEAFLGWNRTRTWRGRVARDQQVSASAVHSAVLTLRNFLDDITLWGWADRPRRRLVFSTDVPSLPRPLPRALPPDQDTALMAAVHGLSDRFARCAIQLLRLTGLRLGELLDLEIDCVVDYGPAGTWLRVPLGKLNTERSVPLDAEALAVISEWLTHRGAQRPLPHPKTGRPTDFLFCEQGRRLKEWRIRRGLTEASKTAGLSSPDGEPQRITPHQLRHTYATSLINAGMSLQALMSLLGHVTPEMTLRYAQLASPALRAAYEEASGKIPRRIPVGTPSRPPVPSRIEWIASEMLKTRVAHGYCSRHVAAEACPYANICEQCDNFVPTPEFVPALEDQLADLHQLQADAKSRGWDSETERHNRVIASLEKHLSRLRETPPS